MAKRTVITNKGLELLASSSEATGQYWWIGYYGLAYVPNFWKESPIEMPDTVDCDNVNGTPDITDETEPDVVVASMTHLTKKGDMIYNIFQGDLVGTGYYNCISDGSAGGDLFGLTMYNANIKKHYRYVLDKYGNNTLVTWVDDPTDTDGLMLGKNVYLGTDGFVSSEIPIPAPLYYMGNTGNSSVDNFFPDFENEVISGANIYPFVEAIPMKPAGATDINVPKVSVDYREYLDSQGNNWASSADNYSTAADDPTYQSQGSQYFDYMEIPADVDSGFDTTSWYAADITYKLPEYSESEEATICKEFWRMLSISNYNLFHAPVGSVGHVLSSDLLNRNMAKVTKFFPISNYKVINTEAGTSSTGEEVEVATAISVSLDIDLAPRVKAEGFDETCDFDEDSNLSFFDKYSNPDNPLLPYADNEDDILDQFGKNILSTTHTSFKFNRIGLYAVPLRKCPFIKDESDPTGKNVILQFEINPDMEPILYAVVDWDNTVSLDDTGNGIHQFRAEINLKMESPAGNLTPTELVRDSVIYYNMYEDDSLAWYQNQLVATASTQNSITEIGLEVANIKNKGGEGDCCPPPDLSKKYAAISHSHLGVTHISDGIASGTIRGFSTKKENQIISITTDAFTDNEATETGVQYRLGSNSSVLGGSNNYIHASDSSFLSGLSSYIYNSDKSAITAGHNNMVGDQVSKSLIGAGYVNRMASAESSIIGAGESNRVIPASGGYIVEESGIVTGKLNTLISGSRNLIGAGNNNQIKLNGAALNTISVNSIIGAGDLNKIYGGQESFIGSGYGNTIQDFVEGQNYGVNSIVGGSRNYVRHGKNSIIGGGQLNTIHESTTSFIGGGSENYIYNLSTNSSILNGDSNVIKGGDNAIAMGKESSAVHPSQLVHSSGKINVIGDSQRTRLVFSGSTPSITSFKLKCGSLENVSFDRNFSGFNGAFSGTVKISGLVEPVRIEITAIEELSAGFSVTVTAAKHLLSAGEYVVIDGSTYHDGRWLIYYVTDENTFVIHKTVTTTETTSGMTLTTPVGTCLAIRQFSGYYNGEDGNKNSSWIETSSLGTPIKIGSAQALQEPVFADVGISGENFYVKVWPKGLDFYLDGPSRSTWTADVDMLETKTVPVV